MQLFKNRTRIGKSAKGENRARSRYFLEGAKSFPPSLLRSRPPFLLPPPPSQMVVEALLATEGFVVTPAMDGPEALQARYDNNA